MELPVIIAIVAVLAVVLFASGALGGKKKTEQKQQQQHTASTRPESAPAKAAAPAASAAAPAVEKDKKGRKKKNRSNKTKAQKEKARAAAAVAAAASASSASEAVKTDNEVDTQESSDPDSDSDSSDDEDNVPSGVRFQAQAQLQAEKIKAERSALLEKEKSRNAAKPAKSALKGADEKAARSEEDDVTTPVTQITDAAHFDGWAVVEDKRKNKPKKAEPEEAASPVPAAAVAEPEPVFAAPPAPVVETVTSELKVDPKRIGFLIGAKGVNKIQIQTLTGTTISMPKIDKEATEPATVSVSGPALGVSKAVNALNELVTKGYALLLEAEDFQESYVAVHPRYLPDVIGKGGASIRALQQHTGVKITVPSGAKGPSADGKVVKVKVGLAGRKEKVSQARALIKDLCKYYYTPVTHPGVVHEELELDSKYFNFIIGAKGSEIKNIQNTHKVQVHIPNADTLNTNVVIVGGEAGVANAKNHIEKIIARVDGAAEAALAAAESAAAAAAAVAAVPHDGEQQGVAAPALVAHSWASKSRLPMAPKEDEVPAPTADDAWMSEFVPPSNGMDLSAMLPSTAKFAPQPILAAAAPVAPVTVAAPAEAAKKAPVTSAWNNLSSLPAEKW